MTANPLCSLSLIMIALLCVLTNNPSSAMDAESRPMRIASDNAGSSRKPPLPPAIVTDLKHWSNPDYTRIVVSLSHEAEFEAHGLRPNRDTTLPSRIYIDIRETRIASGVKDVQIGDGLLKTARVGQYRPNVARIVLDVENIKEYRVFSFSDPFRIVIDVKGERKTEIATMGESISSLRRDKDRASEAKPGGITDAEAPLQAETQPAGEKGERKTPIKFRPGRIRRIVVDPGHGGHDPGAIGAAKSKEKDIVLAIGLKLAERLRSELDMDVVMTRSTDVFIPLEERTAIANKINADLFISIHANASLNRRTTGIETYYLNLAKTDKAKQLAARENNTSLEKVSVLQGILFDLMANSKINDSAHLADVVQQRIVKRVGERYQTTRNNGVKQGPFYVLLGATMPSILVETAFISNEVEEKNLNDSVYQETTVEGIVDGVRSYIK